MRSTPSTIAASSLQRRGKTAGDPPTQKPQLHLATRLEAPACVDSTGDIAAADLGTATHTVLRLLDFRDAADEAAVRRQIDAMIDRHQIEQRLARKVDAAALAWLAGTELGRLLQRHNDELLRELPVRVPAAPEALFDGWAGQADGPMDRVLLRGQVDVVLPLASSLLLADYKTDRLAPNDEAAIKGTLQAYRPQLSHYRRALERITGQSVEAAYLILLDPRRIESM